MSSFLSQVYSSNPCTRSREILRFVAHCVVLVVDSWRVGKLGMDDPVLKSRKSSLHNAIYRNAVSKSSLLTRPKKLFPDAGKSPTYESSPRSFSRVSRPSSAGSAAGSVTASIIDLNIHERHGLEQDDALTSLFNTQFTQQRGRPPSQRSRRSRHSSGSSRSRSRSSGSSGGERSWRPRRPGSMSTAVGWY